MGVNAYMRNMSRSSTSSATADLFNYVPSAPAQRTQRTLAKVKPAVLDLSTLSDPRLARLLGALVSELRRRKHGRAGQQNQPELDQAIREAARAMESFAPRRARRTARQSSGGDDALSLQEPKRKAIRAALQAGVAPSQVAKHFGLSLAVVRTVLTAAE
jgi:hypothetical protein